MGCSAAPPKEAHDRLLKKAHEFTASISRLSSVFSRVSPFVGQFCWLGHLALHSRDASGLRHSITLPLDYSGKKDPDPSVADRTILRGSDDDMAETINAYRDAGLDEIIVSVNTADLTENTETMTRFMEGAWAKI